MTGYTSHIAHKIKNYQLFIFDLDGTLYDQRPLRLKITSALIFRFFTLRTQWTDIKIISEFRKQRELHKGYHSPTLINEQYQWCADVMKIPVEKVKKVVEFYMYLFPLKFLKNYLYPGAIDFLNWLRKENILIAVYSDFPVDDKLKAMEIKADLTLYSAHDPVNCMKPTKTGLQYICNKLNIAPENAVYIGDRNDTDGESARMAGVEFLHIDADQARRGKFYKSILNEILSLNDNK